MCFLGRGLCVEVKFHRDVNHNYMMLQSVETPDPDAYENRVILANRIRGLLPCRLLYLNGDTYYSFDITSMQSLEILRGRRILSGDGFSSFFYELIDVLCGLEEYLLDFDHLILTPDKIYIDPSGGKIGLVYFPAFRKDIRESLRELVEYLLTGTDPDDRRTTLLGYRVYHALQREELLLGEIRGLLTESEPETETPERPGKNQFYEKDVIGPFQQKYAEIHSGGDSDVTYSETYRSGSGPETASYSKAEKVPKLAVIVFLAVGLLSTAITYAFLHLGLGRILAEHSDLLIRIGGACAVILLFAAAFHFAGKSRKMNARAVGMPEEEFSRYDPERFADAGLREEWEDLSGEAGKFRKDPPVEAGKFRKDPLGEPGESIKSPFREISPGTEHEEDYTCLLRMDRKGVEPGTSARLVPLRDDEDGDLTEIALFEGTVIVGKSGELSDRVIPRATVSRVHARIRFSEGACYIMDVNSRNGTFRNGEILPGGEEVRISDGDEISFADAGYRFHMEGDKET